MAGVMLIFAFSMSLVINLIEKQINPKDELNSSFTDTAEEAAAVNDK